MNRTEMVKVVSNRTGLPSTVVDHVIRSFLDSCKTSLALGEEVSLRGFGRFVLRVKKPRVHFNPATREEMHVPEVTAVAFLPARTFKHKLNGRDDGVEADDDED